MSKPSFSMARRIEVWPVERVKPYANNAKRHPREQLRRLRGSIERFGFNNPILVAEGSGEIVAGHGRLMAAIDLGMTEVPVVVLDHLSASERRAYVLADNKLAELAEWDDALLAQELAALQLQDFDLNGLGFSDDEIGTLLGGESEGDVEEEESDGMNRDVALAIVLTPEELAMWRRAKAEIGYSTDKAAFWKLVEDLLEEVES